MILEISISLGKISKMLPNVSGFVVKAGDINGFVDVIERLILNPELRISMGQKGMELSKTYDNKILGAKLQDIYNTIEK